MFPEGKAGVVVKNKEALEPGKTGTTKIENHQVRRRFRTKNGDGAFGGAETTLEYIRQMDVHMAQHLRSPAVRIRDLNAMKQKRSWPES